VHTRLGGLTAAAAAVAVTAGCGLTGTEPAEPSQRTGRITLGDKSRQTQSVKCTQNEWALLINANADPGGAQVSLQLGGQTPSVNTVAIDNIDGLNAVAGGDLGKADASLKNNSLYTITGTATVTDSARPAETTQMPFTIEAPC
jgi:ipoprotein LpqH